MTQIRVPGISMLALFGAVGAGGASATGGNEGFVPPVFERQMTVSVEGAPADVCRLYANRPRGDRVLPPSAGPDFPSDDPQSGALYYQLRTHHGEDRVQSFWYVPIEDNAANGVYRELWVIPGEEFLVMDARCVTNAAGGTDFTVRWRVAAPTPEAVEGVVEFFRHGMFEARMTALGAAISDALAAPSETS